MTCTGGEAASDFKWVVGNEENVGRTDAILVAVFDGDLEDAANRADIRDSENRELLLGLLKHDGGAVASQRFEYLLMTAREFSERRRIRGNGWLGETGRRQGHDENEESRKSFHDCGGISGVS